MTSPLDRETTSTYDLTVTATDMSSTSPKSASLAVLLSILDVNDNSPVFTSSDCDVYVPDVAPVFSDVLTVTATDADVGVNGEMTFFVSGNNSYFGEHFWFDVSSRQIKIMKQLSIGNLTSMLLNFTLHVRDKGNFLSFIIMLSFFFWISKISSRIKSRILRIISTNFLVFINFSIQILSKSKYEAS